MVIERDIYRWGSWKSLAATVRTEKSISPYIPQGEHGALSLDLLVVSKEF